MKNKIPHPISAAVLACILATAAQAPAAAPDAPLRPGMQPLGETVADRPSAVYRYETHNLASDDGKRHYRIQIAIPRKAPASGGSPALYMLDGNAALATLTPDDLDKLGQGHAPVLVALGYDVDTRNDVVSRAYDYTPPVFENGKPVPGPVVRGRVGGGADIFLAFIRAQVKPLVRERAAIDPEREYLWGHSYGGLFALHVLFTQPQAFSRYIVGDPSAWWHDGALIQEWRRFDARKAAGKRVAILVGTKPRDPSRPTPGGAVPATSEDPRAAVREMAQGLQSAGADASYEAFPQFGHGEMIRASLERALEIAIQP
ncbi:alpha/beta hydrolase [Achromobacter pulmonis]|uniref:alpha/beta hydrolase n=1 Tax=Achromobacter pulmonis TaxID=1389932 RepID=UPI001EEC976D|nr:alpha/beta hydrolase-fold protein [Achromobacter pulmonis]MCF7766528.1 prolyl oligopeptidase family serine peptidase [Achromobacter pulmonis]